MDYRQRARRFYMGKPWRSLRARVLADHGYVCAHCGGAAQVVDHIRELDATNIDNPEVALNEKNCQPLCHDCHNKKTFRTMHPVADGLAFNERGELVRVVRAKDSLLD